MLRPVSTSITDGPYDRNKKVGWVDICQANDSEFQMRRDLIQISVITGTLVTVS